MYGIVYVATITRFLYKLTIAKIPLEVDDWLILATTVACIPGHVITEIGTTRNGLGKDVWTLTPNEISSVLKYLWVQQLVYYLIVAMTKLCLLVFYLRIFPVHSTRRLLQGTMIFVIAFGIAFMLGALLQCRPISFWWQSWDGQHQGKCRGIFELPLANSAISIALDLWMLAIPLFMVRRYVIPSFGLSASNGFRPAITNT
jgi:hypothetical protein